MGRSGRFILPATLFLAGLALLIFYDASSPPRARAPAVSQATRPAVTVTAFPATAGATATIAATATAATLTAVTAADAPTAPVTPGPTVTGTHLATPPAVDPARLPLGYRQRFGITASDGNAGAAYEAGLPFGSYLDWHTSVNPSRPGDAIFWQMIRLRDGEVFTPWEEIDAALAANPGAIWLIGNEPDVAVQDNTTPQTYAGLYHQLYTYIKERDPRALVAVGGAGQPTPLRRAYLDVVLQTYQETYGRPMPVDLWNVHAFILREERDSWGVGIPPGLDDALAMPYEIADHVDIGIFRQNLLDFRRWMARRGYGNHPLVVSEYGFIMPYDYGFSPEGAADFLTATFDFFYNARDDSGYAADDNRLVQWWFWFTLSGASDGEYATSYLFDRETGQLTILGQAFADFFQAHAP